MAKGFLKTFLHVVALLCFFVFFVAISSLVTFKLLVTGREIEVPNLIGLRLSKALEMVNKSDLNLHLVEKQYNSDIPEDYIINQQPLPGIKIKSGGPIRIIISAGSRIVLVPDLTKKSIRQAQIILNNSGLEIGNVSKVFSDREMQGLVLNQDPLPNEDVQRYSPVNLLVSKGPRHPNLIMPDFMGMKMEVVAQMLDQLGLNIEDIVTQKSDVEEGTVLMQQPLAGAPVNFGDKIRLVISGEESVVGAKVVGLAYQVLKYKIPGGFFRKKVKIILDDEAGTREIYNRIMRPNADLTLTFGIQGKARVQIFIDNRLQEEKFFEEEVKEGEIPEESVVGEGTAVNEEVEEEDLGY